MATLHIENFPDDLYAALRDRARREHRSVAQEIIQLLGQALENDESLSILDLQGLGRDLWDGVDAADYVLRERDAWDCLAPAAPSPAHRRFGRFPGSPDRHPRRQRRSATMPANAVHAPEPAESTLKKEPTK